jgi:hypothetical protein
MGVECSPEMGTIKVFLKMSQEDFIYDYRVTVNDDENFEHVVKIDTNKILVSKYVRNRVHFFANDINLKGKITGIDFSNGDLKLNLLYHFNKNAKHFTIQSAILTGLNRQESTLLIFRCNDFEDGVTLTPEKPEYSYKMK